MRRSILHTALQASALCLLFTGSLAQTSSTLASLTVQAGPIQTLNCYSRPDPLTEDNTNTFQSSGACQIACGNKQYAVMAVTGGSTCYCGNELPALDKQVSMDKCNSPCQGYDPQTCGGIGYWQVFLTGLTGDVQTAPNSTTSASSVSQAPSSTAAASSRPAQTVVITQSASAKPSSTPQGSGPNKVGIAVGVVVGVIAIAAIAGIVVFFVKQKRRKQIHEEHKAQAAVNSFVGSRSSDTKSDARLDPSMASSFRRESIGSIADERDFSRRILLVRNPDNRGSLQSVA